MSVFTDLNIEDKLLRRIHEKIPSDLWSKIYDFTPTEFKNLMDACKTDREKALRIMSKAIEGKSTNDDYDTVVKNMIEWTNPDRTSININVMKRILNFEKSNPSSWEIFMIFYNFIKLHNHIQINYNPSQPKTHSFCDAFVSSWETRCMYSDNGFYDFFMSGTTSYMQTSEKIDFLFETMAYIISLFIGSETGKGKKRRNSKKGTKLRNIKKGTRRRN